MNKLKKNQMTLDFGQKDLGLKQCKECNMIYNLDDKQDTELHSRYHRQQDNILKFSSCKNEKVVQEYASLNYCIIEFAHFLMSNLLQHLYQLFLTVYLYKSQHYSH
jgi:hypothetical protein